MNTQSCKSTLIEVNLTSITEASAVFLHCNSRLSQIINHKEQITKALVACQSPLAVFNISMICFEVNPDPVYRFHQISPPDWGSWNRRKKERCFLPFLDSLITGHRKTYSLHFNLKALNLTCLYFVFTVNFRINVGVFVPSHHHCTVITLLWEWSLYRKSSYFTK